MLGRRGGAAERRGTPADLLAVGLANPGAEYVGTRHNVGAEVIELLADRHGGRLKKGKERALVDEVHVEGRRLALAIPVTYMNSSAEIKAFVGRHGGVVCTSSNARRALEWAFQAGQRVSGKVTRVQDFGAFVEIEPGVEGLIHVSEMSWGKKVRIASDILKPGERVDAVILSIKPAERRIALGLKQTLTDPWSEVAAKFPAGSHVEGPVT